MPDLISVVDWSRWQFALTAMYHWLFVPLTLGLSVIVAIMESLSLWKKSEQMLRVAQFWSKIFAVNFVCGVATGIILEFEFGTNWSNYSWFVGDIFGAPLAIEGLIAFFMESTFVVVMLFGWKRVGPRFHLASTWLTAIGAAISALWILVANAWMQYPVGMTFNPDTMRNEMTDFWSVALSPVAMNKLLHAVTSGWALAGVFVIGVCCFIAARRKDNELVVTSVKIAAWVGLAAIMVTLGSGHSSAVDVSRTQPMKLAAMEGLWRGRHGQELVAVGILNPDKKFDNDADPYIFKIGLPNALSWMARGDFRAFVPGIYDIVEGADTVNGVPVNTVSYADRMARGARAREELAEYSATRDSADLAGFRQDYPYFGYGYYNDAAELVPPVAVSFYAFHLMVIVGGYLLLFFIAALLIVYKRPAWIGSRAAVWIGMLSIVAVWCGSQAGWVCAEVGRQPWVIQDIMPTRAAISAVSAEGVELTFWLFAAVFTLLLAAEISILIRKIRNA